MNARNDHQGTWGLYPWFVEDGLAMIAEEDQKRFPKLQPYGKVFYCIAAGDGYLTLQYGEHTYRVKPDLFQPVEEPAFSFGAAVRVKNSETQGIVRDIEWHHKEATHLYYLEVNGKRKSKRYFAWDLERVDDADENQESP